MDFFKDGMVQGSDASDAALSLGGPGVGTDTAVFFSPRALRCWSWCGAYYFHLVGVLFSHNIWDNHPD